MPAPLHFKWEWDLQASPLQLWPFLSDTNQFNRDAGLPSIHRGEIKEASSGALLNMRTAGMLIKWEEKPFEWIAPFEFGVERIFKNGPVSTAKIKVQLKPQTLNSQGVLKTHVIYESWLTPRNLFAKAAVWAKMQWSLHPKLNLLLKRYDLLACAEKKAPPKTPAPLKNKSLIGFSQFSPSALQLAAHLETADDLELVQIRPYALAKEWNENRKEVLAAFLEAAHRGLLEFQWEIICPHCRGSERRGPSLGIIRQEGYCQSCGLHYTVNFDKLIELTFRPNPKIRKISAAFFCTGGPRVTPHIITQKTIPAGESIKFSLNLEPGLYRLRGVRAKQEKIFSVSKKSRTSAAFKITADTLTGPEELPPLSLAWEISNASSLPFLCAVEQMKWAEDRVPGRDVIHMKLFRELFQTQCLRPRQPISLGDLTLVFTDLKGSTKLYQEMGDPAAFSQVLNHFDVLQDIITAHDGTVIKTIGDSVMAVFDSPAKALLSMASAQKSLAHPPPGTMPPLQLKIGLHKGANLVVNLNDRLDYFGSAVNIAARLVNLSSGQDIIISSELAEDSETAIFLNNPQSGFHIEKIQTEIKGFGKENFTLFRLISK